MSSSQTSAMPSLSVPFTIDTVLSGPLAFPDTPSIYRIRAQREHTGADGPTIKYLTAPNTARVFTGPVDAHQHRLTSLAFDCVPEGDWVVGRLAAPAEGGAEAKLELVSTDDDPDALAKLGLGTADPAWCGATVDEADCPEPPASALWTTVTNSVGEEVTVPKPTELQCMSYLSAAVVPAPQGVGDKEVVVRVSDWMPSHWENIENEARTHHIIAERDPGLAPRFLAYVTENRSRVVGFLLEHVPHAREAGLADLDKCRAVLARLHALGIPQRRLSRESFLVREDGSVLVRGPFEASPDKGVSEEHLRAEMESLERVLAQSPSAFERQIAKMLWRAEPSRDMLSAFQKAHGFIVPFAVWQDSQIGRVTLTVEEHGILAKEYEDSGFRWTDEMQERAEKRVGPAQGL